MATSPRQITLDEFGRRLRDHLARPDCRVVWFLGAGCSISSGIPGAAALVDQWLPRLKRYQEGGDDDWAEWARGKFAAYADNPALVYGQVIEELFPTPRERQQEVERLTSGKEPAIGYALLALLMAHDDHGPRVNVVLTTNFDDLIADALYLLTWKKPLVVAHENLALFVRASESRPLVVKVHGDARLAPRNTTEETAVLDEALRSRVVGLLQGCMLIFCGYGGNDESIAAMIREAEPDAFPLGIYWIGSEFPTGPMGDALRKRQGVVHIDHGNFDTLMIALADALAVKLPAFDRWTSLFGRYESAVKKEAAEAEPGNERESATRLQERFEGWRLLDEARKVKDSDPDRAGELLARAASVAPNDPAVLNDYAIFLQTDRKNADEAEDLYGRAIDADPTNAVILGNYACFVDFVRGDAGRAEALYRRAMDLDPDNAVILNNYGVLVSHFHDDDDRYEELLRRALGADPRYVVALTNLAQLLFGRGDDAEATRLCEAVIEQPAVEPRSRLKVAFLLYAHVPDRAGGALDDLRRLLAEGHRDRWSLSAQHGGQAFSITIDRARAVRDPRLPFLTALANVMADQADLSTLDGFPEWAKKPRTKAKRARPDS